MPPSGSLGLFFPTQRGMWLGLAGHWGQRALMWGLWGTNARRAEMRIHTAYSGSLSYLPHHLLSILLGAWLGGRVCRGRGRGGLGQWESVAVTPRRGRGHTSWLAAAAFRTWIWSRGERSLVRAKVEAQPHPPSFTGIPSYSLSSKPSRPPPPALP